MNIIEIHNLIVQHKWLYSVSIFVAFFVLAKVVYYIIKYFFLRLADRTKTEIDNLILTRISHPFSVLIVLIGLRLAIIPLGITSDLNDLFGHIIYSLVILVLTFIVIRVFDVIIMHWGKGVAERSHLQPDEQLVQLVRQISKISLWVVGALFVLQSWGVQIGPLLASLGILGIAVAFAMQQTLANIFGGVSLIVDKTLKVGDQIKLDEQTEGYVQGIGLRSTRIRTYDNDIVVVPNGKLADARIFNYITPDRKSRVVIPFTVAADTDADQVKKIAAKIPQHIDGFMAEPEPVVIFNEISDFGLKFKLYFWVDSFDKKFMAKHLANELLHKELKKAKLLVKK